MNGYALRARYIGGQSDIAGGCCFGSGIGISRGSFGKLTADLWRSLSPCSAGFIAALGLRGVAPWPKADNPTRDQEHTIRGKISIN